MSYKFSNEFQNQNLMDFPDPFRSFSNTIYPNTIADVFKWAEWIWTRHGLYSQAIRTGVRYFLGGIEIEGDDISVDKSHEYIKFLEKHFGILDKMAIIGDDVIGFGNSFTSVMRPIKRTLICPKCKSQFSLDNLEHDEDYKWKDFEFVGKCQACKRDVVFKHKDSFDTSSEKDQLQIIRWEPQNIIIEHCPITDSSEYYYDIPPAIVDGIKKGKEIFIKNMPWEMILSVKDNKRFKFNKSTFCHIKNHACCSMLPKLKGWGLPKFMSNFAQVVHLQILERYNEALSMDYIVPFRLLTPPSQVNGQDPMLSVNMGNFMGTVRSMIKEHRRDPTTWHTLPMPVEYQVLSGEAKSMVPVELLERALNNLLTSMGIPQEFYRTSISMTGGPPISLRMFERTWSHHITVLETWLNWFLDQCSRIMAWEAVEGRLIRTSVLEDDMTKQVKLNLASAQVISQHTALRSFDIDSEYEIRRMAEEAQRMEDRAREMQQKSTKAQMYAEVMQPIPPGASANNMGMPMDPGAAAAGGGGAPGMMPPAGAAPMGGGGAALGPNPTIEEIMMKAQEIAAQIMSMDMTTRRQQLIALKKDNPTLHAQVKQAIEDMENQAGTQGIQAARQGQM